MFKVGLTGGIGCGKSTVCGLFREQGVTVIDTDELAREVVSAGSAVLSAITQLFGEEVVLPDGELDRSRVREIVFTDDWMRSKLEAITHPAIRSLLQERLCTVRSSYVIIAIPLLIEKQWQDQVDRLLVVDCSEALQLQRAMARDGCDEKIIRAIINSQVPRKTRLEQADDIIHNDADLDSLRLQVETLHHYYTTIASDA